MTSRIQPMNKANTEQTLARRGLALPKPAAPVAAYIPTRRTGSLVFVSGQIPIVGGELMATGRVPADVPLKRAVECARQCVLNGLAAIFAEIAPDEGITKIVRLGCFVACEPGFGDQPRVANGASELLVELFGDAGRHARAAVGSVSLPLNVPVEIEMLVEVG